MIGKKQTHPHLRLAFSREDSSGYKSGRSSERETPESDSSVRTRSAGTPLRRHLSTACGEIPSRLARAPRPPTTVMTRSKGFSDMHISQPQVDFTVNLPLVVHLNPGLHAFRMSPLGKTIKSRLKALGRTQAWLAEQVGVSENAVSKWIKSGEISRENIKPAADALEISVAQLLDQNPMPDMDERWHSFPPAVKQRVLALIDELVHPRAAEPAERPKSKRRA
jgi:transcriptional regulator with XRE-family HTH domain